MTTCQIVFHGLPVIVDKDKGNCR